LAAEICLTADSKRTLRFGEPVENGSVRGKRDIQRRGAQQIFALPKIANLVRSGGKPQISGSEMKRLGGVLEIKDSYVVSRACDRLRNPDGGSVGVRYGAALA